jgi:NitT/TauT family transport system substrate-binding protein
MRKIFSLVVAGAALVAAGTARAQSNKLIIAVGGKTIIANLPLPVAYYHGDFESEGLDVDIQGVQNGRKAVEVLVGGSADMVYGAIDYAFLLQPKGMDIVSLFLGAHLSPIVLGLPPTRRAPIRGRPI